MVKKIVSLFFAFTLVFGIASPFLDQADAKPKYRSPSQSFTPGKTTQTPPSNNINNGATTNRPDSVNSGTTTNRPGAATPTTNRGGLFGGGLMQGLMLGGLAGLLFGGLLSGLGAFGNILGLLLNVAAIVLVIVLIRKIFQAFRNRPRGDYR